jgi:hypothetical protein
MVQTEVTVWSVPLLGRPGCDNACAENCAGRPSSGIYEGPVVKPEGADFAEKKSSATSSSPSASVDLPLPDLGQRLHGVLFFSTSSEPEAEGDQQRTPSWVLRAGPTGRYAQASIRAHSPRETSHVTKFERRHHSHSRRFPAEDRPSCHCSGSSFPKSSRPPRPAPWILSHASLTSANDPLRFCYPLPTASAGA